MMTVQVYRGTLNRTVPVAVKVLKLTTQRDVEEFHRVRSGVSPQLSALPVIRNVLIFPSCLQEIERIRFLSGLSNVVTSFPYRPRHTSWFTVHLVMELMEVRHR